MKIALVQQHATRDKAANVQRGLDAVDRAVARGAQVICFAELAFEWFHPQTPAGPTMRALSEPIARRANKETAGSEILDLNAACHIAQSPLQSAPESARQSLRSS